MIYLDFIFKLSLLVALSIVSGFIEKRWARHTRLGVLLQGALFGGVAALGMLRPLSLGPGPGPIFDGRSIMVSLCALFFGPLAAAVAGAMTILCRIGLGGPGVLTGVLVTVSSAGIGLLARFLRLPGAEPPSTVRLYLFGLVVHFAMLALMLTLPDGVGPAVVRRIGPPVILIYPLATILAGKILTDQVTAARMMANLQQTKQNLAITLQSIGDAVISTNLKGEIVFMNPVAEALTGWPQGEAVGRPLEEVFRIVNEETREKIESPVSKVLRDGVVAGLANHTLLIAKDGKEISVTDSAAPIRAAQGEIGGVVLVFHDQTEERRAQEKLLQAEEQFRTFFENAPIGKSMTAPDGTFLRVNPAFGAMLGYSVGEMQNLDIAAVTHPGDLGPSRECVRSLIAGETETWTMEKRFIAKDGRQVWGNETTCLQRDADGRPLYLLTHVQDVTERKRAEDALRESEARYRTIFDHGADGIVIIDPETAAPVDFNNQACAQLGYTREEFGRLTIPDIDLLEAPDDVRVRIRKVTDTGYDEFETLHRTKHGEQRNVHVKAQYISGAGKPLYHCIWRDITERKRAEAEKERLQKQLLTAQRMEAVGTLAGGIAHDFNNALMGIIGFTEVLRDNLSGNERSLSDLNEIMRCAERASMLTRQLLTYARRQIIDPVNLDLNQVIADLMKLASKVVGEQIEIRTSLAADLPAIRADVGQIEQVVMNLVLNARDAMPGGGRLTIETGTVVLDAECCRRHPEMNAGSHVVLTVSDTGIGMDKSVEERAFEPFFTTKRPDQGSGLGLSMVYGIVKQHNGFINLRSEPGKGSSFKIHFPAVEGSADVVLPPKPSDTLGGTETILLAEDDESVRRLVERTLTDLGYTVLAARDGQEAVEAFRRNGDAIDLALLDVVMPRKGGKDAYGEMRKVREDIRAVFMSGYTNNALHESFVLNPGVPFLSKPFTHGALARKVREVLDGNCR